MPDKKIYAVLTGDIINSSDIEGEGKDLLIKSLKDAFKTVKKNIKSEKPFPSFNIFRGDSFQGVLPEPSDALKAALLIRTSLIRISTNEKDANWDARVAIGIGAIDYLSENISESDGPAYRNSGPVLDEMKGDNKLAIKTPDQNHNREFSALSALLDAVMNKWTPQQAEIVFRLLQNQPKKKIGKELDISQAAVHYRVKAAGWFAVEEFLDRYQEIMRQY